DNYRWVRSLELTGGLSFVNPSVDIGVRALQAKSHLNRFIGRVEDLPETVKNAAEAVVIATCVLAGLHPADAHAVRMRAPGGVRMPAYATGASMTQEL